MVKKNADYSALTKKTETNPKAPKFKVSESVRITKYKNNFSKDYTEISIIDSVWKTNLWTCKIKDLNGEKPIARFYEKELLLSRL